MCVSTSASSSKSQISQNSNLKKSTWKSWKKPESFFIPQTSLYLDQKWQSMTTIAMLLSNCQDLRSKRNFRFGFLNPPVRVEGLWMFWKYFYQVGGFGFGAFRILCDDMPRGNLLRFLFWTKIFSLWNESCFLAKSWRIPPIKKEQLLKFLLHFELGSKKWGHLCSHHARCHCLCEEWSRVGCWRGAFFVGFHIEGVHMFSPPKRGRWIFIITQVVVSFFKYIYIYIFSPLRG